MSKIFISHATVDAQVVTPLVDLLQNQFGLTRDDFYYTSDEQIRYGDNWISDIQQGMSEASLVIPFITPNYMESPFCLCELGATWVNKQALLPVICPPLRRDALAETPYRYWMQVLTLNNVDDLARLAEAIKEREIGDYNSVRFMTRARKLYSDVIVPFIASVDRRETINAIEFKKLKKQVSDLDEAYNQCDEEASRLAEENKALREMKDAEQIQEYDFAHMDEWDHFKEGVLNVIDRLKKLDNVVCSVLYHGRRRGEGFIAPWDYRDTMQKLVDEGVVFNDDDGYHFDANDPAVRDALDALEELEQLMSELPATVNERFQVEYPRARFDLQYSTFWEEVLKQHIIHSSPM